MPHHLLFVSLPNLGGARDHPTGEMKIKLLCSIFISFLIFIFPLHTEAQSTCYGTTSNGKLENGVKLPARGKNYKAYSSIGVLLGRNYVHSKINDVIINTYSLLYRANPSKVYVYGETGFKKGGKFKPHKTHQNGLSVDFMVPVINKKGKSIYLPTSVFNKFGYNIEFDKKGKHENYKIDYESMALHIKTLHEESLKQGINIWRVIFDPQLQPYLFKTKYGKYLKQHIKFSKKRSWVRHDEHYHVDFLVKCDPL